MQTFAIGNTYTARSACDHECIYSGVAINRTAKSVTFDLGVHGIRTRRVFAANGAESVLPFGRYSMAPVFSAARAAA